MRMSTPFWPHRDCLGPEDGLLSAAHQCSRRLLRVYALSGESGFRIFGERERLGQVTPPGAHGRFARPLLGNTQQGR